MKSENDKEERNAETKNGSAEKNMQYSFDMDTLIVGIEEINHAMPLRGNAWVVEER